MHETLNPIGVLRNVRSEYGKQIRKQYESGNLKISRHLFLQKEIRNDGVVNTLDSVQKDNLLAVEVEPMIVGYNATLKKGGGRNTDMCKSLNPIGGVYYGVSRAFLRGIYEGGGAMLEIK